MTAKTDLDTADRGLSRPWEIWLVHHTHVDIGYTEPQDVILRKHAEFVAMALDYCTATDALPPGERFCWTCEVSWTAKAFLARFPERAAEFFRRVREGRIEVTALYLQLTDLFTQELLEETTDYAMDLAGRNGFEVVTAMNDDVNGWTWGLPDMLSRRGVRYMDTAINETRALAVRPRPAMFRWTGPQGGSLLFWHSDGYLSGNGLALSDPGAPDRAAACLKRLEDSGYPHNVIEMRVSGENHDNAPPGLWLSETVRRWNAGQGTPKMKLVTPRTWFEEAAAHWPMPTVEHRAGWPDWWADGNGSAVVESALVRKAQADLLTLKALAAAGGRMPPADRVERARDAAAFFCEHTWGAWCSIDDPSSLTSRAQWNNKAGYAYTAAVEADSLVRDLLTAEARALPDAAPGVLVFNPAGESRTDVVELLVPDADAGFPAIAQLMAPVRVEPGPAFHLVDAETGQKIPVAREPAIADSARRPAQRVRFLAAGIPARGFRRFLVAAGEAPACGRIAPAQEVFTGARGIESIRDRRTGMEWFRAQSEYGLGELVYETIPGPFGRERLCGWGGIRRDAPFVRTALRFAAAEAYSLPYGAGLRLAARDLPGSLRALTLDVVTCADLPRVDLCYRLEKTSATEAEALYVAFPLGSNTEHRPQRAGLSPQGEGGNAPVVWLDLPGAVMRPGRDQVPGTATDWHSIQRYFAVAGADWTNVVASPDVPLVQVNGINTGRWQEALPPHNGLVMSWVFNNYWFTNFPAAQGGVLEWRYSLCAVRGPFSAQTAGCFADSVRQPLAAIVVHGKQ